jgi:hypothetical protein
MSYYNGSLPVSDYWSGYVAQSQLPSTPRLALLALVNIPIFAIVLNVIWQLVRDTIILAGPSDLLYRSHLVTALHPQLSSTGFLSLDRLLRMATTPLIFSSKIERKYATSTINKSTI